MDFFDYMEKVRVRRDHLLLEWDAKWALALKDDAELAPLRAERQMLRDLPATLTDGDRAHLIAQWPAVLGVLPAALLN